MANILSCDPGLRNFAVSVIQMKVNAKGKLGFRVLENCLLPYTVTQVANSGILREEGMDYRTAITNYIEAYDIQLIAAERYMTRGLKGITIEVVNMMLGWLMFQHGHIPQRLVSAATWKNALRRLGIDLDDYYMMTKVTPHQLDSTMIGVFVGALAFKQPNFGSLPMQKLMVPLLRQLEETSTSKLIQRKGLT